MCQEMKFLFSSSNMIPKHTLFFIFIQFNHIFVTYALNNACYNWIDYYFIGVSPNCYNNPDVFSNTPEILARHVGTYETHEVTTDDGYVLTLFRIPKQNPKGVIILQHPITGDAVVWVAQSNSSLAFILSDAGYDVWLPNHRGTYFSEKHVNMSSSEYRYWNFSFHEIGIYDYSAIVKYIGNVTNTKAIFIGHSMATTSSYIYAALKPQEAEQHLKLLIHMSPVAYLKNVKSPIKYVCPFERLFEVVFKILRIGSEFTPNSFESLLGKSFVFIPAKKWLVILLCFAFGWTPEEYDPELYNLSFSLLPRAFSWNTMFHYAQQVNSGGRFQYYDYGITKNLEIYQSTIPPEYPLENITIPTFLMTSWDDYMSTPEDANLLYDVLPNKTKIYGQYTFSGLNHVDFHFGKDRKSLLYNVILNLISKI